MAYYICLACSLCYYILLQGENIEFNTTAEWFAWGNISCADTTINAREKYFFANDRNLGQKGEVDITLRVVIFTEVCVPFLIFYFIFFMMLDYSKVYFKEILLRVLPVKTLTLD